VKLIGIILIVLGVIGLAYGGISWTHRDKVADLGPVEVTSTEHKSLPLPPVAGAVCLVAGVILVMNGNRRLA
jgi:hypothetical protein